MPLWFLRAFTLVFGLVWGSFLNVVIHRVPHGQSVVRPASRCPHCGAPIRPWNNLPVISWLLLRGRARCCKAKISPRYVLVEAAGGLLALAVLEALVVPLPPDTSVLRASVVFLASFSLALGLTAAAFIDLEHMYIPDSISLAAVLLGLATVSLRASVGIVEAIVAGLAGFLTVWLVFGVLYRLIRGRTGMGLGDAKLLAVAGVWFGWKGLLFALLAGAVQGTMAAMLLLIVRGRIEDPEAVQREREELLSEVAAIEDETLRAEAEEELRKDPIFEPEGAGPGAARVAFGPFLVLAIIEYLLLGPALVEHYWEWLTY